MAKHHHRRRRPGVILPVIAITILLAVILPLFHEASQKKAEYTAIASNAGQKVRERITVNWQGHTYALREDLKSIVLIGTDEDDSLDLKDTRNPSQCDFIAVMVMDERNNRLTLLPINQDTLCVVPMLDGQGKTLGTKRQQLALAHTYGTGGRYSCQNTLKAVSNLLYGVPLGGYARIRMDSIPAFNDAVGGATVTLVDDFSKLDPEMLPGETITLTGSQAEMYVRAILWQIPPILPEWSASAPTLPHGFRQQRQPRKTAPTLPASSLPFPIKLTAV